MMVFRGLEGKGQGKEEYNHRGHGVTRSFGTNNRFLHETPSCPTDSGTTWFKFFFL